MPEQISTGVSPARAADFVRQRYGIAAEAHPLFGEKDLNFRLQSRDAAYILKIANTEAVREELEFQIAALEHAGQHPLPTAMPRVIRAVDGSTLVPMPTPEGSRWVHLLSYIPGRLWAHCNPHTDAMLQSAGQAVGALDAALRGFSHPLANRPLKWNLSHAIWIREYLPLIEDAAGRALVERHLRHFETNVLPELQKVRRQVVYNDANDYNVICTSDDPQSRTVVGLIDFGDSVESHIVCDAAITCAYLMMDKPDPIGAACQVVTGFHHALPLDEAELELLFPLIVMRLCVSVANAAWQLRSEPANQYLQISARPAWELLRILESIHPRLAHYRFRAACGFAPVPAGLRVAAWLQQHGGESASLIEPLLATCPIIDAGWGVASPEYANPSDFDHPAILDAKMRARRAEAGALLAIGGYNEARTAYSHHAFRQLGNHGPEWRAIHIGLDLFAEAGTPIFAPIEGEVHSFANNDAPGDYGPCLVLRHRAHDSQGELLFHTLYGHLSLDSLNGLKTGQFIPKGARIGALGAIHENGGWPPHLHLQVVVDMLEWSGDFPGACVPLQRATWLSLCPDPSLLANILSHFCSGHSINAGALLARRQEVIGYNLSVSYQRKLHIVRGYKQWLYDADGQPFLDCVNNVPHVGHCHPKVVKAGQRQMTVLNTNTRYLHELLVRYAERLTGYFPPPLSVCFLVNSGSEANELALRLVRAHTRQKDMVVVDVGYHGNTTSIIDVSSYKFDHKGGMGHPDWVHKVIMPDRYRGPYKSEDPDAGAKFARHIAAAVDKIAASPPHYQAPGADVQWKSPRAVGAFLCEGVLSCGGQIVLPPGYLGEAYRIIRAAGGLCISDEVQTGFGRVGSHFWAFETQGVIPDIVTLGKPIGNGHPLGAVITTPEIAASFHNGLEYFNTFGGNPVSCAIGLAVLDVIEEEGLQRNALETGNLVMEGFRDLMQRHSLIGDVRGLGLFCGFELVRDRHTLPPATEEASYLANRMRDLGVLISTDGPFENVIKIKPPLCFNSADAAQLIGTLDRVFHEDFLRRSE